MPCRVAAPSRVLCASSATWAPTSLREGCFLAEIRCHVRLGAGMRRRSSPLGRGGSATGLLQPLAIACALGAPSTPEGSALTLRHS
eukprot:15475356-Alexandrium_andersonii.AAC.1